MTEFNVNLRKCRENMGVSQKKAAAELGISQALLSHYEKGIRECGHKFLIDAAKYYGVTTDDLLGSGQQKKIRSNHGINTYSVLYKKLINNTVDNLFGAITDKELARLAGLYISFNLYALYKLIYNGENGDVFDISVTDEYLHSKSAVIYNRIKNMELNEQKDFFHDDPYKVMSAINLIKNVELYQYKNI